jgi:hypothetical protein
MGANVTHQCPHCGAKEMYFPILAPQNNPNIPHHYAAFSICGGCHGPVCMQIVAPRGKPLSQYNGNLKASTDFIVTRFYPEPEKAEAPEHIPPPAASPFIQAVESRRAGHYDAAGAMYRKALDVGLKAIDPLMKGVLHARIEKLAEDHRLTPSLKEWAHGIRLDGNDASHAEEAFTKEEAEEMHAFTQLVLTYLFTLPEKVRLKGKA